LENAIKTYVEKHREPPVAAEVDVLIAGGGSGADGGFENSPDFFIRRVIPRMQFPITSVYYPYRRTGSGAGG